MAKDGRQPRWQLAKLRRLRSMSQAKLAAKVRVDTGTVSRWERGVADVSVELLEPLAKALGVTVVRLDKVLRNEDEELSDGGAPDGAEELRRLVPEWLSVYLSMEQTASLLRSFAPDIIPGLVQTKDYARALMLVSEYAANNGDRAERLVDLRVSRRAALMREENPLELVVVLGEAALRTIVGGREVMRVQLEHLAEMAERENLTVQVLPFASGPHAASYGPFSLLSFPWDATTAYIESYLSEASYVQSKHQVDRFTALFERLSQMSLSPDESLKLIRQEIEVCTL